MKARILDITAEQYHADPCETPSLSSSVAKLLVDKSPLHAWSAHPRFGGCRHESTKAMDRGTLGHRLLLGKGAEYVSLDFDDYKTKAAQSARDHARECGKLPVLARALESAMEMAERHRTGLAAYGVVLGPDSEVALEWREKVFLSDREIVCRSMFDNVDFDAAVVRDLKIVTSAHPDVVSKNIVSYGYDIQYASYTSALQTFRPEHAGRVDFLFLFCESEEPYAVQPYRLDGSFREHGQRRWDRAVRIWDECLRSGKWPGYSEEIASVAPPQWAMARELDTGTYGE